MINHWIVVLWGGNGEHPYDCAEMDSWAQAYEMAREAACAQRRNPELFERRYMS